MSRIQAVTLDEFKFLIRFAQEHHSSLNEPIPEINPSQYSHVNSCLNTPFQTFDNRYLYPRFYPKAAILFYLINKNHCLLNGNKRMACLTLGYFCLKNNYRLDFPPMTFYEIAKDVTNSDPEQKDVIHSALVSTFRKFVTKG